MTPLLKIAQLSKTYDKKTTILKDINLSVENGEFVVIIGKSGAGKSTLLNCINRLTEPTTGTVHLSDTNITTATQKKLKHIRTQIGMIFQQFHLVESSTVIANVLHGTLGVMPFIKTLFGGYTKTQKDKALHLLTTVGLSDKMYQKAGSLSGGQMQRIGICRALMQSPKLLLADEPIASLDPVSATIVMNHLKNITADLGVTCLVNLHQVDIAKIYATRIIGLKNGQIVFDGPPESLNDDIISYIYEDDSIISEEIKQNTTVIRSLLPTWKKPWWAVVTTSLIVASMLFMFCFLNVSPINVFGAFPRLGHFAADRFWPPNFGNIHLHMGVVMDTVYFAVVGTLISGVIALGFSLLMSVHLNPIAPVRLLFIGLISIIRNIPLLVWANLFIYIFGIGPMVGILALLFATLGFLSRSFADTLDDIAATKGLALKAVGANYMQRLVHGLIPEFTAAWVSWTLFAFEINMRASGILGMVGAGGLGILIQTRLDFRQFPQAIALVILLGGMVLATELLSNVLRKQIEKSKHKATTPLKSFLKQQLILGIILIIFFHSYLNLQLSIPVFLARLANAPTVLRHFWGFNFHTLPEVLTQLTLSIAKGASGLILGACIAFVLAFFASEKIGINKILAIGINGIISTLRAIPTLVIIILTVASLGFGNTSAVVGITLSSAAFLTKAFVHALDGAEAQVVNALKVSGASKIQILFHVLIPSSKSMLLSWLSIRLESNIADAVSLGIVGAGGIGVLISRALRQHDFVQVTTILTVLVVFMILLELSVRQIKKRL